MTDEARALLHQGIVDAIPSAQLVPIHVDGCPSGDEIGYGEVFTVFEVHDVRVCRRQGSDHFDDGVVGRVFIAFQAGRSGHEVLGGGGGHVHVEDECAAGIRS